MALPAYRDVDLALLLELVRLGGPAKPLDTYERVARHFPFLTPEDRAQTRADGRTKVFQNMVHWARDHLRVRGLLLELAGQWQVNSGARAALLDDLSKRGVTASAAEAFVASGRTLDTLLGSQWAQVVGARGRFRRTVSPAGESARTSLADVTDAGEDGGSPTAVKRALLGRLNAMEAYEFEQLVARVLDGLGFRDTQVVGRSGDEGVDVVTWLHSPLVRAKVAVQVKRHGANVGPKDVSYLRDRWAHRADKLLFITTADFTAGAKEVAAEGSRQVNLVSGQLLAEVMIEHEIGVRIRPQVTYELSEEFFTS